MMIALRSKSLDDDEVVMPIRKDTRLHVEATFLLSLTMKYYTLNRQEIAAEEEAGREWLMEVSRDI